MRRDMRKRGGYIGQAWLVLTLAVCFGGALAGVYMVLQDKIVANKLNETRGQLPELVRVTVDGKVKVADVSKTEEWVSPGGKIAYKAFDSAGEHIGWLIKATGQGFADKIELLIGLNADATTITGMYVLDQKETPGLGANIAKPKWEGQFAGKSAIEPLEVTKTGAKKPQEINAVTGATISSRSVCNLVNRAVAEFRAAMSKLKKKD